MSLLIKNGLVYDGTGEAPTRTDILIRGQRIARLGHLSKRNAVQSLDATGAIVIPGFVDINNAADHHLSVFTDPSQENLLKQGITTIIGGHCGSSLAPLPHGELNPSREGNSANEINIGWHSVRELLKVLKKRGLGVNFGTLVGHTTMRQALIGEEPRDLTEKELTSLKRTLSLSLLEGAFGLSTGLEYPPTKRTSYHELLELTKVVAGKKRLYATHPRDLQVEVVSAVQETIDLAKESGCNTEISHFQPLRPHGDPYQKTQQLIEEETAASNINFDCHPAKDRTLPVKHLLPNFFQNEPAKELLDSINSPHLEKELLEHLKKVTTNPITIRHVPDDLKFLKDKPLKEYAANEKLSQAQALLKLMRISHLRALVSHGNLDQKTLDLFLASPASIIASHHNPEAFLNFLQWAQDGKKLTLEKAIAKTTSIPAQKIHLQRRGVIKENHYADLLILKDLQPTTVIVNGQIAIKEQTSQKILAGQILKARH